MVPSVLARLLLGIALASALLPARAEEGQAVDPAPPRHHLSLGAAAPSLAEIALPLGFQVASAIFRAEGRWKYGGGMVARVERDYAPTSIGLTYGLGTWRWTQTSGASVRRGEAAVHTLQAQLLWRYVSREHLSVYSGLAGGLIYLRDRERGAPTTTITAFGASLTPVGLAVGGRRLRAFAELGVGLAPLASAGVTCQF